MLYNNKEIEEEKIKLEDSSVKMSRRRRVLEL